VIVEDRGQLPEKSILFLLHLKGEFFEAVVIPNR
jgi:hypothetical protein